MPNRQHYQEKLDTLHQEILRLSTYVEELHRKGLEALMNQDYKTAEEVIQEDTKINDLQLRIENECANLIAIEQPVGQDLRFIVTALKIVSNLERIGDHAVHLGRHTKRLYNQSFMISMAPINEMASIGLEMMQSSIKALLEGDADSARKISARDDEIDEIHGRFMKELINKMQENPQTIEQGISLLLIARFMERMGDHVTNICEWIVYAIESEHVELN
ncbi:MAG: phosphate signaling complex protein PhoU [Spirochaetales bacterium]|nr:phosphate signaling complex protein PhoU [Spirochaetales bacterium]MCF7937323.1 phosphate signaling complex protein PhoU [Spirochaetales bacterium]